MTQETMAEAHGTQLNKAANELTHVKSPSKQGGRGKGVQEVNKTANESTNGKSTKKERKGTEDRKSRQ